ncbi:hypothetical protein THAOC_33999 [Thalassiosira oceanica]|uniref:RxLR effector protein n=1 Tax=Thalassiosira oceanica TaxID=159749 RepID=K0R483_THAOC|nr:hypothetical protein THAOC_33999 [Thalassiosira oceanica]|eukprot:EJK47290.1 hypothetical protein THAOC_33999 [Thalassiosira oceanica]
MNALIRSALLLAAVVAVVAFQSAPVARTASNSATELYIFGKKPAPAPVPAPAPKKAGFSFGRKAAPAPVPAPAAPTGIVRGFSKSWNSWEGKPFQKEAKEGDIVRGFSKSWNRWEGKPFQKETKEDDIVRGFSKWCFGDARM